MGFLADFKAFAIKGNVIDLAVGVVIGAAFGKIVSAVVDDIIMPLVAAVTPSGTKFTDNFIILGKQPAVRPDSLSAAKAAGINVLAYGDLIQTIVDFLIVAFCIFLLVKGIAQLNRKKEEEAAAPAPPTLSTSEQLLVEIRDSLKAQNR